MHVLSVPVIDLNIQKKKSLFDLARNRVLHCFEYLHSCTLWISNKICLPDTLAFLSVVQAL